MAHTDKTKPLRVRLGHGRVTGGRTAWRTWGVRPSGTASSAEAGAGRFKSSVLLTWRLGAPSIPVGSEPRQAPTSGDPQHRSALVPLRPGRRAVIPRKITHFEGELHVCEARDSR